MSGKYQPIYHVTHQRTKLENVIPLDTPFSIYIEPSSACNLRCRFCPQCKPEEFKKLGIKMGVMSIKTFEKIITGLKEFPRPIKTIHLFFRGEPLLNPNLPEMIHFIKQNRVAECVSVTTNGVLLNEKLSHSLIDAGLDNLKISVEAVSTDGFLNIAGVKIDFERFVENIQNFYQNKNQCHVYIKALDSTLTQDEKEMFKQTFGSCSDEYFIERLVDRWNDIDLDYIKIHVDDNVVDLYDLKKKKSQVCPLIFYSIVIAFNGNILPCFEDWQEKYILGNTDNSSVARIWNSDKLNSLRQTHLKMDKNSIHLCKVCKALDTCAIDNIDDYASTILNRFEKTNIKKDYL